MTFLETVLLIILVYVLLVIFKILATFALMLAMRNRDIASADRRPIRFTAAAAAISTEILNIFRVQTVMVRNFLFRRRRRPAVVYLNASKTPILLVPGYGAIAPYLGTMGRMLRRRGSGPVFELRPGVLFAPIEEFAERLAQRVDTILTSTGADHIDLVAHSMGGLVARYYMEQLDGDKKIRRCITIETPHHGTMMAKLIPGENGRQLRPNSEFLTELNYSETDPRRRRIISIWSPFDNIVIPPTSAILGGSTRNIRVDYIPHFTAPFSPRIADIVSCELDR